MVIVNDQTTETKVVSFTDAMAEAKKYIKKVTPEIAMKQFNRIVGDNVKLDRFLSGNFQIPKSFQKDEVAKKIQSLIDPKNHVHNGLIKIEHQRALLGVLKDELIGVEVAAKTEWLSTLMLNDEQQLQATAALAKYKTELTKAIKCVAVWRQVYGE